MYQLPSVNDTFSGKKETMHSREQENNNMKNRGLNITSFENIIGKSPNKKKIPFLDKLIQSLEM